MKSICLIACASKKLAVASPAQDLYQSDLFSKSVTWMKEQNFDGWFILSAKHGLVSPDTVLDPYDLTLKTMNTAQKRQWSEDVLSDLLDVLDEFASVTFLAGRDYRQYLIPPLTDRGYQVHIPLEGMRIGEQLQWLSQ